VIRLTLAFETCWQNRLANPDAAAFLVYRESVPKIGRLSSSLLGFNRAPRSVLVRRSLSLPPRPAVLLLRRQRRALTSGPDETGLKRRQRKDSHEAWCWPRCIDLGDGDLHCRRDRATDRAVLAGTGHSGSDRVRIHRCAELPIPERRRVRGRCFSIRRRQPAREQPRAVRSVATPGRPQVPPQRLPRCRRHRRSLGRHTL
jgi:hypothetical protein